MGRMVDTKRITTADELLRMPDDSQRHELVRGELRTRMPAGWEHGSIGVRLARALGNHVESANLGETFNADTGFALTSNPDTVRAPDVAFVRRERMEAGGIPRKGFWQGPPDLAAEVGILSVHACPFVMVHLPLPTTHHPLPTTHPHPRYRDRIGP